MAVNPITGINFAVDRFVIRKNGELTNMNSPWGRIDGGPMVGGLPLGEEWFWKQAPAERQAYDHRYQITSAWECVPSDPPAAEGWPTGVYRETVTAMLLPPDELKAQVDQQKMAANASVYPPTDKDAQAALVADALARRAAGTATDLDTVILARHDARIADLRRNEERALELYADIDAGRPYDILAGWYYGDTTLAP